MKDPSSFERAFCCLGKADILEVESVIQLLLPAIEHHWTRIVVESIREIDQQIDAFDAALSEAPISERDSLLNDLVLLLLGSVRRRVQAPVGVSLGNNLDASVSSLLTEGAKAIGEPLNLARAPKLLPAAQTDLMTLVRGRFDLREGAIRAHIRGILSPSAGPFATPLSGIVDPPAALRAQHRQVLLRELGADAKSWVPFVVDQWAYRWFNIGGVVAAQQAGVLALVAVAVRDLKTSKFCLWVDGRLISIERAQRQIERHVAASLAGDVRAIMANWPLLTFAPTDGPAEFELKFASVGLPPYHGHCRTRTKLLRLRD